MDEDEMGYICMHSNSFKLCTTLCQPTRFLHPWDSSGKNTGVGFHVLLQGLFPTQGSNPHLLHLPALAGGFITSSATWEAHGIYIYIYIPLYVYIYIYIQWNISHKNNKILPYVATWMDLVLSELSQTKKYYMISHMENLKIKQTNVYNSKTNKQV